MDGFTYHDIFQTKGIEYIIIIAFLLMLIPFWILINRKEQLVMAIKKTLGVLTLDTLKIPAGIFFNRNHTWAHLEKSGLAEVGMDDLLLHLTGEVQFVNLRDPGEFIAKGDVMAEMKKDGKRLRVHSPVSGRVLEVNPLIEEQPGIAAEDPYAQGWLYRIEPSNWLAETDAYFWGKESRQWFRNELDRFKDFIMVSVVKNMPEGTLVTLQEGGELVDHSLANLPDHIWQDFQKEFLDK